MRSFTTFISSVVLMISQQANAFVAPRSHHISFMTISRSSSGRIVGMSSFETEVVDPFDSYTMGQSIELATRDTFMGDGEIAEEGAVLSIKYEGRLLSTDKQFDSGTFSFQLGAGSVIVGWEEGMEGMRVGGKRTLKIPPRLAYGDRGAGDGVIPPNADLIFDCELISVATGPVAETMAKLGIGLNARTGLFIAFILSIVLPQLGIGEKGFI